MAGEANMQELINEGLKVPGDSRAKRRLEELVARGEFEVIDPAAALAGRPRYLVTFMRSLTGFQIRSATVVTVTNQAPRPNPSPSCTSSGSPTTRRRSARHRW